MCVGAAVQFGDVDMRDEDKTKEQLIDDLAEMRRRNAELEAARAELKRMYEALEESEERYRDLLENSNDLVQSVAPDGHFLYVNRAWRDILGYSIEEVANLSLFDIIHPQSQARCRQVFQEVISGDSVDRIELQLRNF